MAKRIYARRLSHSKKNKELVTGRITVKNNKYVFVISIGLLVCDIISFKKDDPIEIHSNKKDKNLILVKKSLVQECFRKLSNSSYSNDNFLKFTFVQNINDQPYKVSQTIVLDYEFNDKNLLVIDLKKLKWER